MQDIKYEHILELSKIPKEYTLEMALDSKDIIRDGAISYNTNRLHQFIQNANTNIPDKIKITDYGIDSLSFKILQYDGTIILLTEKYYIQDKPIYHTYYGYKITQKTRRKNKKLLKDYFLITLYHDTIPVFIEPY